MENHDLEEPDFCFSPNTATKRVYHKGRYFQVSIHKYHKCSNERVGLQLALSCINVYF